MDIKNSEVRVDIPVPQKSSRVLAVFTLLFMFPKLIFLIPHFIILWALGIVLFVLTVFAQFAVVITGTYPEKMHHFVVGIFRWQLRVNAYLLGLRDEYPPFTLEN